MNPSALTDPALWSGMTSLPNLGVIRAAGDDAAKFLQGQLTQDVLQMGADQARLAALCNAKGRMQASFVLFSPAPGEILLVCSLDLLAQTLQRLRVFVLRAKVTLTDATADYHLYGLAGDAILNIAVDAVNAWQKLDIDQEILVVLYPAAGLPRALLCSPAAQPAPDLPALPQGLWEWLEVQSGIAPVTKPLFEAFVPQMLNYESVGGVSFKKGCYPGQEIVARSQFRGTLKRRAYLMHCDAELAVGQEVFYAADPGQPCGVVAASAAAPAGGYDAIVSMQTLAAAGNQPVTVGGPEGPILTMLDLPYPLLEDI